MRLPFLAAVFSAALPASAAALNYWITPSVPLKAAYNVELDGTDALFLEWSVGF